MDHTVLPANTPCLPFLRKHSSDGATPNWGKRHPIAAYYSSIDLEGMKGWVGSVGWPIAERFTHISCHPSATGRAQDRESSPAKDRRSTTVPCNQRKNRSTCSIRQCCFDIVAGVDGALATASAYTAPCFLRWCVQATSSTSTATSCSSRSRPSPRRQQYWISWCHVDAVGNVLWRLPRSRAPWRRPCIRATIHLSIAVCRRCSRYDQRLSGMSLTNWHGYERV